MLRMNSEEDAAQEIFQGILELINGPKAKIEDQSFELANKMNAYLKGEWERLKVELSEYTEASPR